MNQYNIPKRKLIVRLQVKWANFVDKVKCFFKGHRYNYQLGGWEDGGYKDLYLCCDRCNRNFTKIPLKDIKISLENT